MSEGLPFQIARVTIGLIEFLRSPRAVEVARSRVDAWRDQLSITQRITDALNRGPDVVRSCGEIYMHLRSDEDRGAILQRINALRLWSQVKAAMTERETLTMPSQVCPRVKIDV
jgi:hypothetical protein